LTIVHLGNGVLRGLSTDTKPTTYPVGSTFLETDTGNEFYYNGTSWVAMGGAGGGGDMTTNTAQTVSGLKTYLNGTLGYRNIANNATATVRNPVFTGAQTLMLNEAYDYFVFIDTDDSNKIKAKQGRTQTIPYQHNTDAGNVLNSVINDLAASAAGGGEIVLGPGTFLITTTVVPKNLIKIRGAGDATILKLANTTNADIFKSFNFDTLTGTNNQGGVQGVVLQDFTIDGNYSNNLTSGYGIRYYGWNWKITNVSIKDCRNDGIYSEWYNGPNIPLPYSMETAYVNLKVHHCQGVNIRDRGPHDSEWVNVLCWAGVNGNVVCETSANYSSGIIMSNCHFWSSVDDTINFLIDGAQVFGAGIEAEGTHGTNGIGLKVTNSGKIKADNVKCFANVIGCTLNSSGNELGGSFYSNSSKGMIIAGNDNIINGVFRANTDIGLEVGASGATQANRNFIIADFDDNANHIKWWDNSSYDNMVIAHIETGATEEAMDSAGVNPNLALNCILIDSKGAGTNYTLATPLNFANGAQLATANIFAETLTINKANQAAIAELLQQWSVDDDTTSYLKVENFSSSNAIFIPRINALSNLASSSSATALEIRGQLRANSDIGSVPVIILDGRLHTSAGAVAVRPVAGIRTNGTDLYLFYPGKMQSNKPIQAEDYQDAKVISAPADPTTGYIRRYPKTVDANNDGWFIKAKVNGAVQEIRIA
jgi:hypothetical protein